MSFIEIIIAIYQDLLFQRKDEEYEPVELDDIMSQLMFYLAGDGYEYLTDYYLRMGYFESYERLMTEGLSKEDYEELGIDEDTDEDEVSDILDAVKCMYKDGSKIKNIAQIPIFEIEG